MRAGSWLAAGALLVSCLLGFRATASWVRGRTEGLRAADADIARGTPSLREFVGFKVNVTSNGYGIDLETGLPLHNTARMCGTGVDSLASWAQDAAYNEAIRAAFAAGELGRFSLSGKVRTAREIQALFAASHPTELADDAVLRTANGTYEVVHRQFPWDDVVDEHLLCVEVQGREAAKIWLFYPRDYAGPQGGRRFAPARGPLAAIVTDDETSVILRDADNYAWVIDLPRAVVVHVVGPISSR